jgi:hypothetical protein
MEVKTRVGIYLDTPELDLSGPGDIRKFKVGEPVCIRNNAFYTEGKYVLPLLQPGSNKIFVHIIQSDVYNIWIKAEDVGKCLFPVSPTAIRKVIREKTGKDIEYATIGF